MPKLLLVCLLLLSDSEIDVQHIDCIPYMFAEINAFRSLKTANVDAGRLPEWIPCKILVTYDYIKMF